MVGEQEEGGCYGTFGRVRLQWEHTRKFVSQSNYTEGKQILDFAKGLDIGTILRHHVVGDFGKIKSVSVQNKSNNKIRGCN